MKTSANHLHIGTIFLIFFLTFFLANVTYGGDAKYLKKGDMAPFAGMLLTPDLELKARTAVVQNDEYKDLVADQYEMINVLHQSNNNKSEQIAILQNKADDTFTKILYFVGGVVVGGMAVQAVNGK